MDKSWKAREREINRPFVDELRAAIARARLTPTEVARRAGFHQGQTSEWLSGATAISLGRFVALARAAGLGAHEISDLIKRADERARADDLARARAARMEALADGLPEMERTGEADTLAAYGNEEPDARD